MVMQLCTQSVRLQKVSIGSEFYTAVIVSYITVTFLMSEILGQLAQILQELSVAKH